MKSRALIFIGIVGISWLPGCAVYTPYAYGPSLSVGYAYPVYLYPPYRYRPYGWGSGGYGWGGHHYWGGWHGSGHGWGGGHHWR